MTGKSLSGLNIAQIAFEHTLNPCIHICRGHVLSAANMQCHRHTGILQYRPIMDRRLIEGALALHGNPHSMIPNSRANLRDVCARSGSSEINSPRTESTAPYLYSTHRTHHKQHEIFRARKASGSNRWKYQLRRYTHDIQAIATLLFFHSPISAPHINVDGQKYLI